jgi:hypothetical protein
MTEHYVFANGCILNPADAAHTPNTIRYSPVVRLTTHQ